MERDILLIYRACFVVNPGLTCFASSSLKERVMLPIHSAYFVSCWFKERDILTHTLYLTKISFQKVTFDRPGERSPERVNRTVVVDSD